MKSTIVVPAAVALTFSDEASAGVSFRPRLTVRWDSNGFRRRERQSFFVFLAIFKFLQVAVLHRVVGAKFLAGQFK